VPLDVAVEPDIRTVEEDGALVLLVGSASNTNRLAGSITHNLRAGRKVVVRAIGAGAVNQAVKAIIVAGRYWAEDNRGQLYCVPLFKDLVTADQKDCTAVCLTVVTEAVIS
jgi:stage V sporulation protein S